MNEMAKLRAVPATITAAIVAMGLVLAWISTPGLVPVHAQSAETQPRPTSTPYAGDLSIFEYPDRDQKLHVERVMDLLGLAPGKSVADVGAGSGWFTVRAAKRVGATGAVYAEDINPKAIDYITRRAANEKLSNIHPVLGTPDEPKLPAGSVDAMLILKTYHEFAHPVPLMEKLRLALKPGGKVGIIDRNGDGTDHGIMPGVVEREMAQAGFKRVGKYDFTKDDGQDYFLIFTPK
jgi:predicted methyltransferase